LAKKRRERDELKKKLASEAGVVFYKCRKGCSRMPFEQAFDTKFRCPQCKSLMHFTSGREELKRLEEKITALEKITRQENFLRVNG